MFASVHSRLMKCFFVSERGDARCRARQLTAPYFSLCLSLSICSSHLLLSLCLKQACDRGSRISNARMLHKP